MQRTKAEPATVDDDLPCAICDKVVILFFMAIGAGVWLLALVGLLVVIRWLTRS